MAQQILLVEDTRSLAMVYRAVLEKSGHKVDIADTLASTRQAIAQKDYPVILLDLLLPDGDGIEVMGEILAKNPETRVIVITANGSINRAIDAMRKGAFDFLVKPFDEKKLLSAVENAYKTVTTQTGSTVRQKTGQAKPDGFIGDSDQMQAIYGMIGNIARSSATVFITGESGTGKEVAANAIHAASGRAKGPFVALNCGAIPADLLESEVFGHLKGSFTGAISDKKGAAEAASGGTLFLDEVCELDLALQTKLLRFLETSTIQPVGAVKPRAVDVRILCATNRDPITEVRQGRFREDLYYRLHVVPLHMPALRDRPDDTIEIAKHMLVKYAQEEGKAFKSLSLAVVGFFRNFDWPGNVRQLLNVLRNVVVLNDAEVVEIDMLPADLTIARRSDVQTAAPQPIAPAPAVLGANPFHAHFGKTLAQFEREFVEATIEKCGGSVPDAAKMLGVSPSTLYRKREAWKAG